MIAALRWHRREPVRSEGEFARLIDGAQQSLALIPNAVAARDAISCIAC